MKRLGTALLHGLCAAYRPFRPPAGTHREVPRSIIIVSNTALGDTLLSTPVVASARVSFPSAHISFVVHPRFAQLFAGLEPADEILTYDGSYGDLFSAITTFRQRRPDAVLLAHSNGPQDIPLAWLSGAPCLLKPKTKSPFKHYLSAEMPERTGHVIEERCNLVRHLGGRRIITRMQLPGRYQAPPPQHLPNLSRPVVALQLGAANAYKQWPAARFAALAGRLAEAIPELNIVLTGSAREKQLATEFFQNGPTRNVHDLTGCFPVHELPWLFRQFDLLVTNDTGPMHLAIALGVPTLSLFGMTSATAIGPYQDLARHIVIQKQGDLQGHLPKKRRSNAGMLSIQVEEVFAAALGALHQKNAASTHH